jgi:hypothetical protein
MGLRIRSLVQFFCELSCPNRREFIREFFEFAARGAFQARIPGDFSPFERNRASVFAETLLFDVASLICCAASNFLKLRPYPEIKNICLADLVLLYINRSI